MKLTEQEVFELQDSYKKIFYDLYNPKTYRFLGVNFVEQEKEPVIISGSNNHNNFYCIANTNGIIKTCYSFGEAKQEILQKTYEGEYEK